MKIDRSSHRQEKVASLINVAVVEALSKGKGLDLYLVDHKVTITRVKVTIDLKIAYCYFLPFNSIHEDGKLTLALDNSKNAIRSYVTAKLQLRYSPEIRFYYDHSFHNVSVIEDLLRQDAK